MTTLLAGMLSASSADAQVSSYSFAQSTGTYTPITGGTVLATATANTIAGSLDSYVDSVSSIPFTFTFNNVGYNKCYVSSNGFITFGTVRPSEFTSTGLSTTATGTNGVVAAFSRDLNSVFNLGTPAATGQMRFEVIGAAPNRQLVIQWANFRPTYTTSTTAAYTFDFQIILEETSNKVYVRYGGNLGYLLGSTTYSGTAQVGLRGATTADFNNRANPTTVSYTASTAGTASSSTQEFNTTANPPGMPTSGLTYTWTPAAQCTGTPTAGTVAPSNISGCAGTSTTLTVSGFTQAASIFLQWQSSPNNTTFTDIPGATSTSYTTGQVLATTFYRVKVRCSTIDSSFTPSVAVTITPPTITTATLPYNQSFENWISSCGTTDRPGTEWTTFPFTSDSAWRRHDQGTSAAWSSTLGAYSPVSSSGASSARFHSYNVSSGRSGSMQLYVDMSATGSKVIAFDHINPSGTDSLFVDLSTNGGTTFTQLAGYGVATAWTTRTLISTAAASNAVLRFRARSDFGNDDIGIDSLRISVSSCPPVAGTPAASGITTTGATITWTAATPAPSGGYDYFITTSSAAPTSATTPTGNTSAATITLTTLTANTTYYVWVRSNCGTFMAGWTQGATFTTLCNAITTIPYSEGFNTVGTLPSCWSTALISGTNNWNVVSFSTDISTPYQGAGFIGKGYNNSTADLISPPFNLSGQGTAQTRINFWMYRFTANATTIDSITFAVNTTNSFTGATPILVLKSNAAVNPSVATSGWYNYTANIPTTFNSAGTIYVVMRATTNNGLFSYDFGLDSFRLELAPSCPNPTVTSTTAITPNGATINWTAPTPAPSNGYEYEVRSSGAPGSGPVGLGASGTAASAATSATVTGLSAATAYVVYVRAVCATAPSPWASGGGFTTPASCSVPTTLTATGITTTSANLGWTNGTFGSATQWQISYGVNPTTAAAGTKVVTTSNPYTLSGLTANTSYQFYVRAICAPGDTSAWSSAASFTTQCNPSTLPFTENFGTYLPSCWSEALGSLTAAPTSLSGTSSQWGSDGYLNNGFSGSAKLNIYDDGFVGPQREWMISPSISLAATPSDYVLEFNFGVVNWGTTTPAALGSDDTVAVVISTDNGATWTRANALRVWTAGNTPVNTTSGGQRFFLPMYGYNGTVKVGWYGSNGTVQNTADNDVFVDSVRISTCARPVVNLGADTVLCPGSTITLNAGTGTSYLWNNGTTTTQTLAVTTPGTYSVTTFNGNEGCFRQDTIVITGGTLPVVSLGNDTAICAGNSITLNAGNPGAAYLYSNNATTQTTTVSAAGTYSVRVTNAQGCIGRDTLVLTVNANPVVNLGPDTAICSGNTLTLNAGNTGSAYLYNTGATTQTLAVTTAGTYSVRVTNTNGCVGRDTLVVSVNQTPVVNLGPDTTLCGNITSIIFDAGNPGSTYAWSSPAVPVIPFTTQTIDLGPIINAGNIATANTTVNTAPLIATVTSPQGCVGRDSVNITVIFTARVSGITTTGSSPTFTFAPDADSFATSYAWNFGDGTGTSTQSNPTYTYTANGTYTVRLIVSNECASDTVTTTVTVQNAGIRTVADAAALAIYPNPATTQAVVETKDGSRLRSVQVYSATGALVANLPAEGTRATVNTASLASGVYTLRIQTDRGMAVRKLEVVR